MSNTQNCRSQLVPLSEKEKEKMLIELKKELAKIDRDFMYQFGKLKPEHVKKAEEICLKNKVKKSCKNKGCYDRGYIGYDAFGNVIACLKCVDEFGLVEDWLGYVKGLLNINKENE